MKILHIWSCAGISSLIGEYMDAKVKTESQIIITRKWDRLGLNKYNTTKIRFKPMFALRALFMANKFDIIHVHYHSIFIPLLKLIYAGPKPIIIHFHGSDLRGRGRELENRILKADCVIVSTRDLLDELPPRQRVYHLMNPVDVMNFPRRHRRKIELHESRALTFSYNADEDAKIIAEDHGIELDILDRDVPHDRMAQVFDKYDFYIDVKRDFRGRLLKPLSKTGLEFLSTGGKVINSESKIIKTFPLDSDPEQYVLKLYGIYRSLLR